MAAGRSDAIEAVIATAPAAYPPWGAWSQFNALKLYPILERIRRARVMLFFFQGDEFDPGRRGPRSDEILQARGLPHLIVDKPPDLTSHFAAGTEQFAADYAACVTEFATDDAAQGALDCTMLQGGVRIAYQATERAHVAAGDTRSERQAQRPALAGSAMPEGHE